MLRRERARRPIVLLLGIDTATRVGSVGLVRSSVEIGSRPAGSPYDVAATCEPLAEVVRDTGLAHGAALLELVDECLAGAGVDLAQVGAVAVSSGPGSFTGLRVALATAKGLALGGDVALAGVPTLEALAATVLPGWSEAGSPAAIVPGTLVASCLDARKGEVYGAIFAVRREAGAATSLERLTPDRAARPAAFRDLLERMRATRGGTGQPVIVLGDGAERYRGEIIDALAGRALALPFARWRPRGAVVARLGAGLLGVAGPDDRAALVPEYARASEAEIARERASR